jgi:DNA-binding SARP family transcriptional activator
VRRDALVALFWPELSAQHARAALRQMLFQLRRVVGENTLLTDRETVALEPAALQCDVVAFEQLLKNGDRAGALDIYRGALLAGFFVDGMSAEFEMWIDAQRSRAARKAFLACGPLVEAAERARNGIAAAQWARAAVDLVPDDEIAVRRLIGILASFGDRVGALRVADEFSRRLEREFGSMPSPETEALVASVRARRATAAPSDEDLRPSMPAPALVESAFVEPVRSAEAPGVRDEPPPIRSVRRRSVLWRASLSTMVVLAVSAGAVWASHARTDEKRHGADGDSSPPMTISSPVARRLYNTGVARYRVGDSRATIRLLSAALAEDSACAMCAYYAGIANEGLDDDGARRMLKLAMRLSDRVSEAERLLIHFGWANAQNSPGQQAVAESLVTRYPNWAEAQMAAGKAAEMAADYLGGANHFRRAMAEDPVADSAATPNGIASLAGAMLIKSYELADSMPAALTVARALVTQRPRSSLAWLRLAYVLAETGRYDEGRAALDSSTRYASDVEDDPLNHADLEIRAGNFAAADGMLRALAESGNPGKQADALWILTISLRTQGRVREALRVATGPLRAAESAAGEVPGVSPVAEGQARFELGEDAKAAEIFEKHARSEDSLLQAQPAVIARRRAWMFTQAASAFAAEGDTVALSRFADTVRVWGEKSSLRRDNRLYLYLQGLLWMARANPDSAANCFRLATVSETDGFSRLNLEQARALMALGRPHDAIPLLDASLSGPIDAGNSFVTRTELQYQLAQAYDMARMADSAATYYRYVVHAWQDADRQFGPSVARARSRLEIDEQRESAGQR